MFSMTPFTGRFTFCAIAADRRATISDGVAHTMHVARIAGAARVGLGSDLDGGFGREAYPLEIHAMSDYPKLLDALDAAGFAGIGGTRTGFAHANLLRILDRSLPA